MKDPTERPAYKLTPRQEISIRILRESIQEFQAWKNAEANESNQESEEDEEGEGKEEEAEGKRATKRLRE